MPGPVALHRVEPGRVLRLADVDPGDTRAAPGSKAATRSATTVLAERLAHLQEMLWAGAEHRVLLVLQGIDTAGKGGAVEHVLGAVNPAGLRVISFKAPSQSELAHDYLWRVHANVPETGAIGVFDRSHYEDVLVVRVEQLVPKARWKKRFAHINAFERLLVDEGTTVVKVFLHISKEEQRRRLQARIDDPEKRWKFKAGDLETRARWDDYQAAFEDAISRTSTARAPWHVVPADKKWYRDWAVAAILVGALEGLDLHWPEAEPGVAGLVVDDAPVPPG